MFSEGVENNRKKWIDLLVLLKFLKKTSQGELCRRFAIFNLLYGDSVVFPEHCFTLLGLFSWALQIDSASCRLIRVQGQLQRRQNIVYRHCLYFRFGTDISQQDTEVYLEPSRRSMMEFFSKNS